MKKEVVEIKNSHIELNKFLKYIGAISTGGETFLFLKENTVLINEKKAQFKRQKLINKTIVKINDKTYEIKTEI